MAISIAGNGSIQVAGSSNVAFTIDSSNRTQSPQRPAFHAHGLLTLASNNNAVYPTVNFNIGGCYSNTTGTFTAPVTGLYMLGWTQIGGTNNTVYRWYLRVNGTNVSDVHLRQDTNATGSEYATNAFYVIPWPLNAGDTVNIRYLSDDGSAPYASNDPPNDYPRFWGYLVG